MQISRLFIAGVTATASLFAAEAPVSTPLYFEPNLGQAGDKAQVQFFSRASGALRAYFKPDGVFLLTSGAKVPVRMELTGVSATKALRFEAEDERQSISAYFIGNDKTKWLPRVPNYGRVRAKDVYPGIDLVFYGSAGNKLEYDFVVKPGADPKQIEISFSGTDVKLTAQGDLNLGGALVQRKAYVHQGKAEVASSYRVVDASRVRLDLGAYDASAELVVDPVLEQYLDFDGDNYERYQATRFDNNGDIYLAGLSYSANFPLAFAYQGNLPDSDGVIQKRLANGALVYSTYLGGHALDEVRSLTIDASGAVSVAVMAQSTNYPVVGSVATAHQSNTTWDSCVTVFHPFVNAALAPSWSSCFPSSNQNRDDVAMAQNSTGTLYLAEKSAFSHRLLQIVPGVSVTSVSPLPSVYVHISDLAVDAQDAVYISGSTQIDLPVANAAQPQRPSSQSGFLAKLVFSGSSPTIDYLTYFGGYGSCAIYSVAVAQDGTAGVAGDCPTAPVTQGGVGSGPTWTALLSPRVSGPVTVAYSTYLPVYLVHYRTLAIDSKHNLYFGGRTFPFNEYATFCKVTRDAAGLPVVQQPIAFSKTQVWGMAVSQDRRRLLTVGFRDDSYQGFNGFNYYWQTVYAALARSWNQSLTATLNTNPAGFQIQVDGAPVQHGSTQTWIENEYHTLDGSAPITTPAGIGYTFASWADGGTASKSVAPGGNVTYTANYTLSSYRLSVGKTGNGTVAGGAINCGTTCSAQIPANTSVTLLATPAAGWTFAGWSGGACSGTGSCTVSMDAVKAVSATFTQGNGTTTPGGPLLLAITAKSGTVGGVRTWVLTITNQDTVAANMDFGPFTLTQVGGVPCNPVVQKAVGTAIGSVASGSSLSTPVPINFAGCPAAARFTLNATVTANGGAKTGSVTLLNQFQ